MAERPATVNPFPGFHFLVRWDENYVAAFTHVSGLSGETHDTPVRLERGITRDLGFDQWLSESMPAGAPVTQELQIDLLDEAGMLAARFNLHDCWVSDYTVLPEFDADTDALAVESVTLQHEGWERDPSVPPIQPGTEDT